MGRILIEVTKTALGYLKIARGVRFGAFGFGVRMGSDGKLLLSRTGGVVPTDLFLI